MVLGTEWYWYRMVLAGSRHAAQPRVSAGSDKARFISRPPGPCIAAGGPASIEGRGERPVGRGNHVARTQPAPCRRRGRSARGHVRRGIGGWNAVTHWNPVTPVSYTHLRAH